MSAGNAGAAIGLANTNKIPFIGAYVQDVGALATAGPGASVEHIGVNGANFYTANVLGEDIGFLVPTNSGVANGKLAQWVQLGVGGIAPGQTRVNIAAGVATFNAAGTHDVFIAQPVATVPAGAYCWAFER